MEKREIKFRVWDNVKMMYPDVNGYFYNGVSEFVIDGLGELIYLNDASTPNGKILQYSGLKDKNGVEIYEGDICLLKEAERKYTVKFSNGCFKLFHTDPKLNDMLWGSIERVSELLWTIEVIGNIYENPELLQL